MKLFEKLKKIIRFKFKSKSKIKLIKGVNSYGLVAVRSGAVSLKQLKSCHYLMRRWLKGYGTYFFRAVPHQVVTKKAAQSRMGKGKGMPTEQYVWIIPGQVIFEIYTNNHPLASWLLEHCQFKIPIKTKIIKNIW